MKFNTQVCTTKEQSERLLALGLKKGTADMVYEFNPLYITPYKLRQVNYEPYDFMNEDIPAWSLHRLISLCPDLIVHNQTKHEMDLFVSAYGAFYEDSYTYPEEETECFDTTQNLYDNMIACIEWLVKEGYFNKEYLEDHS